MPIYEYLCPHCNRVFNFMAKSYAEAQSRTPACPKCHGQDMRRLLSRFSVTGAVRKSRSNAAAGDAGMGADGEGFDDPRVEREMMQLMSEAENMDESDPRQMGRLMRKMSEVSGEGMDAQMEEAVRRLESGEDPAAIEEQMGELFGDEEAPGGAGGGTGGPSYDDGLYSL
jgi:putative FmdB family regulatory protein